MNWIDHILIYYEREIGIILSVLLIVLNLASLYFIIDSMNYDEITGYLTQMEIRCFDLYDFMRVLLINTLLNLLFVFAALFARITKDH
ncbi:hypothetical protein FLACOL7796_01808 [Flavobacterium collinsii]|uniref:Uncharacterized protein n=1 Tax=Flavobacterium collinsii TaxID=1114861 RepID=A0ABM8KHF3_9FLAO|nr:hypothetical protein FLACOL7796_01808 [Flavobacterium collinsii]